MINFSILDQFFGHWTYIYCQHWELNQQVVESRDICFPFVLCEVYHYISETFSDQYLPNGGSDVQGFCSLTILTQDNSWIESIIINYFSKLNILKFKRDEHITFIYYHF